jgi:hypothetical protein
MAKLIQDELTHLALSRQRKYQLRMKRHGRCMVCGKPAAQGSWSLCLRHRLRAQQRRRQDGFEGRYRALPGNKPQFQRDGEGAATNGVKTSPVRLAYQTDGVEVTAAMANPGEVTGLGLTALLQTFLTTLTWMCSVNGASTEGWLTLTLADHRWLWRVTRNEGDSSSLRLVPISERMPAALRSATGCFGR